MVNLRRITHQNLRACIYDIKTNEAQKDFVDSNVESLAEAYTSITNGSFATPYAVYDNDAMVGFVMYTFADKPGGDFLSPPCVLPCYFIWRILIDKNHQRKGYGKQAIEKIIAEINNPAAEQRGMLFSKGIGLGFNTLMTAPEGRGIKPSPRIKTMPHGKADRVYTSWNPNNIASKLLFESFGFVDTGDICDGEVVVRLDI